ncbi:MAG: phosphatase PAP2 family protein [Sedimenticola sp.]|nr:phosphatase PAP2 family protein [Sedimenticola sp.]
MTETGGHFWLRHGVLPLLLFTLAVLTIEATSLDIRLADLFYRLQGGAWSLQNSDLLAGLLHDQAKGLVKLLALLLFLLALSSHRLERLRPHRRALWYLALVMPLSGLLVGIGKELTHIDCPWTLLRYGGEYPYIGLFESHPGDYRFGKCFPAAHAAAGYAFLALYFFLRQVRSAWRWYGLLTGVILGLVFGLAQQVRGAHFVSHDLWTAAICWFNSLGWYWFAFRRRGVPVPAVASGYRKTASSASPRGVLTSEK